MKLSDYTDDEVNASSDDDEESFDDDAIHEDEHEQNDNWEWSEEFTEFIHEKVEGRSLKVCPGLRPIADVNLDIKHLADVADSDEAEFTVTPINDDSERLQDLRGTVSDEAGGDIIYGRITGESGDTAGFYDGYACYGDMFELPFDDNAFDTVIADPPWLNLSADERQTLFEEIVRVTAPTGAILYNATWIPEDDNARRFDLRFRQQLDYWGGPSFAAMYRRGSRDVDELFEAHDYISEERYPENSPFWSEAYHPNALSTDHNTDPKKVSSDRDYQHYCCPMCACANLGHLNNDFFETSDGQYNTYQCLNCEFRVDAAEIHQLADALADAAAKNDIHPTEVTHVDHTPDCIEQQLEHIGPDDSLDCVPFTADLPWVPNHEVITHETGTITVPDGITDKELPAILSLIADIPSVSERVGNAVTDLPESELQRRIETIARAVKETSIQNVRQSFQTTSSTTDHHSQHVTMNPKQSRATAAPAAD